MRDTIKGKQKSTWIIVVLMTAFFIICFFLSDSFHYLEKSESKAGRSVFDSLCFYVRNRGNNVKINVFTDVRVDPAVYYVFLPSFAADDPVFVTFSDRDHIILSGGGKEECRLESGDRLPEVENGSKYCLSFFMKDGDATEKGDIFFLRSDSTATLFLNTVSGSMENINSDKENTEPGTMLLLDENGFTEYQGRLEEIKGHGNSTWLRDKKPYGLKLTKPVRIFDLPETDHLILLSNNMDVSMVRNAFTYKLAEELGYKATPRLHYADVYLNGQYNGLYVISNKIAAGKNSLGITDLGFINAAMNVIPPEGAERITEKGEGDTIAAGVKLDVIPDDIRGGYIIERDYGGKFDSEPSRFTTEQGNEYVIRNPLFAPIEEVRYIKNVFEEAEERIYRGDPLDSILDIDSFVRMYVLDEFTRNEGAGVTSAYYYKDRDEVDPRIYAGPVWDYDQSLGNTFYAAVNYPSSLNFCTDHIESTMLFYELYRNYPEFREKVMAYYKDVFRPYILSRSGEQLEYYLSLVNADNGMDSARWGRDNSDIKASYEMARDFIRKRTDFLDKVWIDRQETAVIHFNSGDARDLHVGLLKGEDPAAYLKKVFPKRNWIEKKSGKRAEILGPLTGDIELIPDKNTAEGQ